MLYGSKIIGEKNFMETEANWYFAFTILLDQEFHLSSPLNRYTLLKNNFSLANYVFENDNVFSDQLKFYPIFDKNKLDVY